MAVNVKKIKIYKNGGNLSYNAKMAISNGRVPAQWICKSFLKNIIDGNVKNILPKKYINIIIKNNITSNMILNTHLSLAKKYKKESHHIGVNYDLYYFINLIKVINIINELITAQENIDNIIKQQTNVKYKKTKNGLFLMS